MEKDSRRRAAIFVAPLLIAFVTASRIGSEMRTVDFLQIFASGMITGVSLMGILHALKKRPDRGTNA